MPSIKCGNCRGTHGSVVEVKDCYALAEHEEAQAKSEYEAELRNERYFEEGPESFRAMRFAEEQEELLRTGGEDALAGRVLDQMAGSPGRDMASEKQIKYALDLLAERQWPDKLEKHDLENMERRQVSKIIDGLKRAPKLQGELNVDPEVGMYIDRASDSVYRFYMGQRSGRVLAKRLIEADAGWFYEYAGAGQAVLKRHKLERMTLEEAKRFGKMSGMCVVCGRRLDVPESVEAGIGPVCANKDW